MVRKKDKTKDKKQPVIQKTSSKDCWMCRRSISEVNRILESEESIQIKLGKANQPQIVCGICKLIIRTVVKK